MAGCIFWVKIFHRQPAVNLSILKRKNVPRIFEAHNSVLILAVQGLLIQLRSEVDYQQYLKSPNNILAKLPSVR